MKYKLNASIIVKENEIILHGKKTFILKGIEDMIVLSDNKYEGTALDRSYDFYTYFQRDKSKAFDFDKTLKVVILGCGGVGANVAMMLATSGFFNFHLIDYDRVDATNLNRQMPYTGADIGNYKVDVLKRRIYEANSNAEISTETIKITSRSSLSHLKGFDIIVSGIDQPTILSSIYVLEYSIDTNTNVIFGGAGYEFVTIGPFLIKNDSKKRYLSVLEERKHWGTKAIYGSLYSSNGILSCMMANAIIGYFYNIDIKKDFFVSKSLSVNPFTLEIRAPLIIKPC